MKSIAAALIAAFLTFSSHAVAEESEAEWDYSESYAYSDFDDSGWDETPDSFVEEDSIEV